MVKFNSNRADSLPVVQLWRSQKWWSSHCRDVRTSMFTSNVPSVVLYPQFESSRPTLRRGWRSLGPFPTLLNNINILIRTHIIFWSLCLEFNLLTKGQPTRHSFLVNLCELNSLFRWMRVSTIRSEKKRQGILTALVSVSLDSFPWFKTDCS